MRNAKHTPGPWVWNGYALLPANPNPDLHSVHTILEVENFAYGFVCSDRDATSAEDDANRLLIAAAPELMEAAKAAESILGKQKWIEGSTDPEAVALYKLRAAIANATKETS